MASTARQVTLLSLLALQVGIQPLLMGWYASKTHDVRLRVGVVEFLKLLLALVPLSVTRGEAGLMNQLKNWRPRAAMATTVIPALIYVLQNLLNHAAVVTLDGVTFNVLNQTKIIWTALLVYLLLGTRQSPMQMVALVLLCVAAMLMATSSAEGPHRDTVAVVSTGVYQALLAALLSALAGSIIQKALQREKRNQYMVTVELSVLGEITLVALFIVQNGLMRPDVNKDSHESVWEGWTVMTLVTLLCQAAGGVLVGFVIRDCGNVEKSFAVVGGMGLTALLETNFNGKPFKQNAMVALIFVAISTTLYTLNRPSLTTPDDKLVSLNESGVKQKVETSNTGRLSKKTRAGSLELDPFISPPNIVKTSVNTSVFARQKTRRPVQPLAEIPNTHRLLEVIV